MNISRSADLYPRLDPTMEWDTAAAQGVVMGAGKSVRNYAKRESLTYNNKDLLNPWFVAR